MKKIWISLLLAMFCLWLTLSVHAQLTSAQESLISIAAQRVINIVNRTPSISMNSVVEVLQNAKVSVSGSSEKVLIVDSLLNISLDKYYRINNFMLCKSYNDGCNTCSTKDGKIVSCTHLACFRKGTPSCEKYDDTALTFSCSDQEKNQTACTLDYNPVCGNNNVTYGNRCSACVSQNTNGWHYGACK